MEILSLLISIVAVGLAGVTAKRVFYPSVTEAVEEAPASIAAPTLPPLEGPHYSCSKCQHIVARYEIIDNSPVCANCLNV